ncbi:MAG TPA: polysaccharide deacetylase family protein [Solirubrobacteraceae bacterium]|nr:polysaccharide deacetylase family protein [Solirubrobacteraceae bacterium]
MRRRLLRRTVAGTLAVVILGVGVVLATGAGSGGGAPHHPPALAVKLRQVKPAPVRHLRGLSPAGLENIKRLLALGLPIYCGGRQGNAVAFTFDDGPGVYTHYALRKLERAHARATFFVVGRSIRAWPGWLRREGRMAALGDHTMTHQDLVAMAPVQAFDEIYRARQVIQHDSGQRVELFRPPYGAHDRIVDTIVHRLGMLDIMWSVDSADSLGANYAGIIRNVTQGLRPGAIIEMHENRGQTIRALTRLLPELRRRHLHSVSVLSLLATDPPSPAQLHRGESGCGGRARIGGRGIE